MKIRHHLDSLSRSINLHLGIHIPGHFDIPPHVLTKIKDVIKKKHPKICEKYEELGPFRGIEPDWYRGAAQN